MSATVSFLNLLPGSSTPLLASGDVLAFVDISDATQSPSGSTVRATVTQFFAALPAPVNITSASATALAVGLTGATNSAFAVDASTALQVAGLKVTGAVTGGTVAIVTTDSGAATNLTLNAKGTGTIGIGSVSTGRVTITPVTTITGALTLSAALTYGGVTLDNTTTGAGSMVLSGNPTFTGTLNGSNCIFTGPILSKGDTAAVIKITNTAGTATVMMLTVKGWVGSGSVTDGAIGAIAGLSIYSNSSTTASMTFGASQAITLGGALTGGSTSDITINTNKFTVAASSGNTSVGGTLTSASTLTVTAGGLTVTAGTSALQAITGTTLVLTGGLSGVTTIAMTGALTGATSGAFSTTVTMGGLTVTGASADVKYAAGVKQIFDSGTNNIWIVNNSANRLSFATAGVEVMRFDSSAMTIVGTIAAAGLPTSAGASGTLYVDGSGFVKRAP